MRVKPDLSRVAHAHACELIRRDKGARVSENIIKKERDNGAKGFEIGEVKETKICRIHKRKDKIQRFRTTVIDLKIKV